MAARNNARAGDLTGRQKAELAEKHAEEQKAKAASIAMATAAAEKEAKEPVDLTQPKAEVPAEVNGDVEIVKDVDVKEKTKTFRVREDLEQVTIGHGNHYDFQEGRDYTAPLHVYNHLEEKGLIWH